MAIRGPYVTKQGRATFATYRTCLLMAPAVDATSLHPSLPDDPAPRRFLKWREWGGRDFRHRSGPEIA